MTTFLHPYCVAVAKTTTTTMTASRECLMVPTQTCLWTKLYLFTKWRKWIPFTGVNCLRHAITCGKTHNNMRGWLGNWRELNWRLRGSGRWVRTIINEDVGLWKRKPRHFPNLESRINNASYLFELISYPFTEPHQGWIMDNILLIYSIGFLWIWKWYGLLNYFPRTPAGCYRFNWVLYSCAD